MSIYSLILEMSIEQQESTVSKRIRILGVPPHVVAVGPDWDFLPPPVDPEGRIYRAVVIIEPEQAKGTSRSMQEYPKPLLTLTGQEYHDIRFVELMYRIEEALDTVYGQPEWKRVGDPESQRWYID